MPTNITDEQLVTMLTITKDVEKRIACNGMPELDQDLKEMIELLEAAVPKPGPQPVREDPVQPIIDPARPPEKKPTMEDKEHKEHTAAKLKELEAEKKDKREEYSSHIKPRHK